MCGTSRAGTIKFDERNFRRIVWFAFYAGRTNLQSDEGRCSKKTQAVTPHRGKSK
jgi:hypothetical protein